MLDAKEIDIEIARLEYGESSYPAYAKLANLYTIRNQMNRKEHTEYDQEYSAAPAAVEYDPMVAQYGDSDFLASIAGKHPADAWGIMDELMDTLRITNPRVYNSVMRKINSL